MLIVDDENNKCSSVLENKRLSHLHIYTIAYTLDRRAHMHPETHGLHTHIGVVSQYGIVGISAPNPALLVYRHPGWRHQSTV